MGASAPYISKHKINSFYCPHYIHEAIMVGIKHKKVLSLGTPPEVCTTVVGNNA